MKRSILCGALLLGVVAGLSGRVVAAPLTLAGGPDLTSLDLSVNYDYTGSATSGTGVFTITGSVFTDSTGHIDYWKLWPSTSGHVGTPLDKYATGTFSLTAILTVTTSSVTVSSGSLLVTGPGSTTLFQSNSLIAFGFGATAGGLGNNQWQFEFTNGVGPGGGTGLIGVNLNGGISTTYKSGADNNKHYDAVAVNLMEDFADSPMGGVGDTFMVVPLPRAAYMSLGTPALLLLLMRRRRRLQSI